MSDGSINLAIARWGSWSFKKSVPMWRTRCASAIDDAVGPSSRSDLEPSSSVATRKGNLNQLSSPSSRCVSGDLT